MRTPRPSTPTRRSINTLIGNGWLSEAPGSLEPPAADRDSRNRFASHFWPRGWDIKSRSALRKCVFLPIPPEAAAFIASLPPPKPFTAVPSAPHAKRADTPALRRRDPNKDVRMFPLVSPNAVHAHKRRELYEEAQRAALKDVRPSYESLAPSQTPRAWYEDPIALGTLLIMVPPIGLAAVWTSKRYSNDARWALTVMTGLTMCLAAAVLVAVMALNSR